MINVKKKWICALQLHNWAHILPCLYPSFCSRFKASVFYLHLKSLRFILVPVKHEYVFFFLISLFLSVCGLFRVPIDFSFGQNAKAVRCKSDSIRRRKCQARITPVCIIVRRSRADCASGFNIWPLTRINTADFTYGLVSIIWIKKMYNIPLLVTIANKVWKGMCILSISKPQL